MMGSHASGECVNHAIIPISKAYENARNDAENEDAALKKKKAVIQSYINKVQQRIAYILI